MHQQHLVIIGNGMAAGRLVTKLVELGSDWLITLIGDEPTSSYNRIMLSSVLAQELNSQQIFTHDPDWYLTQKIALIKNDAATDINREDKIVTTASGRKIAFDRLVIATGSTPALPSLTPEQFEIDGIYSFRNLQDVTAIKAAAEHKPKAVVLGGGLLGLEAAHGLNKYGCDVTVIHRGPWLLNRQLNQQAAELLQLDLEQRGIQVCLNTEIKQFNSKADGSLLSSVELNDGTVLTTELAIIAIGITPNATLGREAGLSCERGICVNTKLQTSDPAIFAMGECSQFDNHTFGLVAPIWDQVDLLSHTLLEQDAEDFQVNPVATKLKVSGIDLFSAGQIEDDEHCESQIFQSDDLNQYRKLIFKQNRLVGAIFYGDISDGNAYFDLIEQQRDISSLRPWLMFGVDFALQQAQQHTKQIEVTEADRASPEDQPQHSPSHNYSSMSSNIAATDRLSAGASL